MIFITRIVFVCDSTTLVFTTVEPKCILCMPGSSSLRFVHAAKSVCTQQNSFIRMFTEALSLIVKYHGCGFPLYFLVSLSSTEVKINQYVFLDE
jgi:hypothetical protein